MMVVDFSDPNAPGVPEPVWEDPYERGGGLGVPNYDVRPDGRHLMVRQSRSETGTELVVNWFEERRDRVSN